MYVTYIPALLHCDIKSVERRTGKSDACLGCYATSMRENLSNRHYLIWVTWSLSIKFVPLL